MKLHLLYKILFSVLFVFFVLGVLKPEIANAQVCGGSASCNSQVYSSFSYTYCPEGWSAHGDIFCSSGALCTQDSTGNTRCATTCYSCLNDIYTYGTTCNRGASSGACYGCVVGDEECVTFNTLPGTTCDRAITLGDIPNQGQACGGNDNLKPCFNGCYVYTPDCNTNVQCGGWYGYGYNTCYNGNASQDCYYYSYSGGGSCNVKYAWTNSGTVNNCDGSNGYSCVSGSCQRNCNATPANCNACSGGSIGTNKCGVVGNGTQACQYSTWNGQAGCNAVGMNQNCNIFVNNCSTNYTCEGGNTCDTIIHVRVYKDYGHNQGTSTYFPNATVTLNGTPYTTDANGYIDLSSSTPSLPEGTYSVTVVPPAGYEVTPGTQTSQNITLISSDGGPSVFFYLTPLYTISGTTFIDADQSHCYNPAGHGCTYNGTAYGAGTDSPYTGGSHLIITGTSNGTVNTTANAVNGIYTTTQTLTSGTYTVSYDTATTPLPVGDKFIGPHSWAVTVGNPAGSPACSPGASPDGTCGNPNSGSVGNLNIGISNENSWPQPCGDARFSSGYSELIPSTASCNNTAAPYALYCPQTADQGILFSGGQNPVYGGGLGASTTGIQVGNFSYPENFNYHLPNTSETSYNFVMTTLNNLSPAPIKLTSICPDLSNCVLSESTPGGVYTTTAADGPVSISIVNADHTGNLGASNYAFVIADNLEFTSNISEPAGYSAAFISGGNIYVAGNVGESDWTSTNPDLEGLFSANGNFEIDRVNPNAPTCSTDGTASPVDKKLNIVGSVITSSGGPGGGTIVQNRDGCIKDLSCPSISATASAVMLLNTSGALKPPYTFWQELNP